jgi:integrase
MVSAPYRKEVVLKTARYQNGCVILSKNGSGEQVWLFRWYETQADGERIRRKKVIGTLDQYKNKTAAQKAATGFRLAINSGKRNELSSSITMSQLITHFRERELADLGDDGRAYSTRDRYECNLNAWIEPRWGRTRIDQIKAPMVEEWLRDLRCKTRRRKKPQIGQVKIKPKDLKRLAPGTKAKIRNLLSVLYNHAIRWGFIESNPISGPTKGSGVRQSSKRERVPDILEVEEIQKIVAELELRERVLLFLDMASGLRRGELAGLKWLDFDFDSLDANIQRSIVDQVVGRCKTEASQKRIPLDESTAKDLLAWYQVTPYNRPEDYVFAAASRRAGKKTRQTADLVVDRDALPHSAGGETSRHQQAGQLAHVPSHLLHASTSESRGCEGGAGVTAARFDEGDTGHLCPGTDACQTRGTAKGRSDDAPGDGSCCRNGRINCGSTMGPRPFGGHFR